MHALRLQEYNLLNATLFSIIVKTTKQNERAAFATANGSGVAAWRMLRDKYGGAGNSDTTLTSNLTALTAAAMSPAMDFSVLALMVRTCGQRHR